MKKYFFKIVTLSSILSYGIAYTQTLPDDEGTNGKVYVSRNGQNEQTPQRTLDVGGAVRLETPGDYVKGAIPLAVDNSGKIVIQNLSESNSAFIERTYIVKVKTANGETIIPGERVIINDLGISKDKYTPVILNYKLMRSKRRNAYVNSLDDLENSTITVQSIGKETDKWNNAIGNVAVHEGQAFIHIPEESRKIDVTNNSVQNEIVFQSLPRVVIRDLGDTYSLTADWGSAEDSEYNATNYWVIDMLLIRKSNVLGERVEVIKGDINLVGTKHTISYKY